MKDELELKLSFSITCKSRKSAYLPTLKFTTRKSKNFPKGFGNGIRSNSKDRLHQEMSEKYTSGQYRMELLIANGGKQISAIEEKMAVGDNRVYVLLFSSLAILLFVSVGLSI